MSLYLILNIASLIIPLLYSFEGKMQYYKRAKTVFSAIAITAIFFILWDIIFTKIGVWSFNPRYHSGIQFFDLPIEEWLFFICIPYASLFIHFAFQHFLPTVSLSNQTTKTIYFILITISFTTLIFNLDKLYTALNYALFIALLSYTIHKIPNILNTYFITFLIILLPFSIVNGILTGTWIDQPVVLYNNAENLGIRLGTIPIEDIGYAFSMLLMSLILIEKIENKKQK